MSEEKEYLLRGLAHSSALIFLFLRIYIPSFIYKMNIKLKSYKEVNLRSFFLLLLSETYFSGMSDVEFILGYE